MKEDWGMWERAGSAGLSLCLSHVTQAVPPEYVSSIWGGYLKGSLFSLAAPGALGLRMAQEHVCGP